MYCKFAFAALTVIIGSELALTQQIPSTTTAAELWNPWTWFWPYAKASAEAYRDYYDKAQKATNELYQQIYKTNAFPWRNWNISQSNEGGKNQSGQNNQSENSTTSNQGENGGQADQGNVAQEDDKGQNSQNNNEGEKNQTPATDSGVQVEGGVQENGTADAEVNANV